MRTPLRVICFKAYITSHEEQFRTPVFLFSLVRRNSLQGFQIQDLFKGLKPEKNKGQSLLDDWPK